MKTKYAVERRENQQIQQKFGHKLDKVLAKYEKMEKELVVMDDYDGGQMKVIREVISDIKNLMSVTM